MTKQTKKIMPCNVGDVEDVDFSMLPQPVELLDHDLNVMAVRTRAEAIADGELIDVTEMAQMMGIPVPIAITRNAWTACIDGAHFENVGNDDEGRLLALLKSVRREFYYQDSDVVTLSVEYIDDEHMTCSQMLLATCTVDESGGRVGTVMLPGEG